MSSDRETTRAVRSWLEEGVTTLPDRVLDGVLDQLPATRQRRSLWRRLTFDNDGSSARFAIAAAAIVIVAILGIGSLPGVLPPIGGAPSPTSSPSPTPTVEPSPTEAIETPLPAGIHSLEGFPIGASLTLPEGWINCSNGLREQGACRATGDGEVMLLIVANVVVDTCGGAVLRDPPVGPSVDDLVAAITGFANFTATTPTDVDVGGFAGKQFTLTAAAGPCTNLRSWATSDRINGISPGEVNLIRIVDVNGTRVLMTGALGPIAAENPTDVAALTEVMDSVAFTP